MHDSLMERIVGKNKTSYSLSSRTKQYHHLNHKQGAEDSTVEFKSPLPTSIYVYYIRF